MKKIVSLLLGVMICFIVSNLSGCRLMSSTTSRKTLEKIELPEENLKDAGNWTFPVLLNAKNNNLGDKVELKQLWKDPKIKLVMVTFWATWGEPCNVELTYINDIFLHYQNKGLMVLAISLDKDEKLKPVIIKCITGMKWKKDTAGHQGGDLVNITYPILLDTNNTSKEIYGIGAIPVTFLVNKNNKIVYQHSGCSEKLIEDLKEKIGELLP